MSQTVQDIKNTLRILNESATPTKRKQLLESQLTSGSYTVAINEHAQLDEASELINLFSGEKDAMEGTDKLSLALAKFIHSTYKLSADAVPEPYTLPRLYLKEFKQNPDNFLIFKGPKGWAAMKPNYEGSFEEQPSQTAIRYIAYLALEENVSTDDEGSASLKITVKELEQKRGGKYTSPDPRNANVIDELREYIGAGRLRVWFIPGAGFQGWSKDPDAVKPSIDREKIAARKTESDPQAVMPKLLALVNTVARRAQVQRIKAATAGGMSDEEAFKSVAKDIKERSSQLASALNQSNPMLFEAGLKRVFPELLNWARSEAGLERGTAKISPAQFAAVVEDNLNDADLGSLIEKWLVG